MHPLSTNRNFYHYNSYLSILQENMKLERAYAALQRKIIDNAR